MYINCQVSAAKFAWSEHTCIKTLLPTHTEEYAEHSGSPPLTGIVSSYVTGPWCAGMTTNAES